MTDRTRKPYLMDLTDEQWAVLEPLIPPAILLFLVTHLSVAHGLNLTCDSV
jgi:transposase